MKIVVSFGGSVVTKHLTPEFFKDCVEVFGKIQDEGHELYITVGGGHLKKDYQDVVRGLGLSRESADTIAILLTHVNANLMRMALGDRAYEYFATSTTQVLAHAQESGAEKKIFVCGGTEPGQSTDGVAAKIAHRVHADVIIKATNIDGVYDSDPKTNPNSKKIKKLTHEEFLDIIGNVEQLPGKYSLFDLGGAKLMGASKIKMVMVNGTDPHEIFRAAFGGHNGTEIVS